MRNARNRSIAIAALAAITAVFAGGVHSYAQRAPSTQETTLSRLDRLEAWVAAVNRHEPGEVDEAAFEINQWSSTELRGVWIDVILALDTSASVSGDRLDDLQKACHALLGRLSKEDKAALLTFSHVVALRQRLTPDIASVRARVSEVIPIGDTSLVDGTHAATLLAGNDGARNLLIVFSDGLDTASWLAPERVLESARRADIVAYSASSRDAEDSKFLDELGKLTGGGLIRIASTKDLSATFLRILDEFRNRYLLSYSPVGVAKDGWHRLEVRLKNRRATIRARAGYLAGP